jgi:hypothetical protein
VSLNELAELLKLELRHNEDGRADENRPVEKLGQTVDVYATIRGQL